MSPAGAFRALAIALPARRIAARRLFAALLAVGAGRRIRAIRAFLAAAS